MYIDPSCQKGLFKMPQLPYAFDALEPYIDARTMEVHYSRYFQSYVDNLNQILESNPEYQKWSLERLIQNANWMPRSLCEPIKRYAGGVYNHAFFFFNLAPENRQGELSKELRAKIDCEFGGYMDFKKAFKKKALDVFGSGYVFLAATQRGCLRIIKTANQDTPLSLHMLPIMGIDLWEHAYYLKHYNDRGSYIDDWFKVVNLKEASENYAICL